MIFFALKFNEAICYLNFLEWIGVRSAIESQMVQIIMGFRSTTSLYIRWEL